MKSLLLIVSLLTLSHTLSATQTVLFDLKCVPVGKTKIYSIRYYQDSDFKNAAFIDINMKGPNEQMTLSIPNPVKLSTGELLLYGTSDFGELVFFRGDVRSSLRVKLTEEMATLNTEDDGPEIVDCRK